MHENLPGKKDNNYVVYIKENGIDITDYTVCGGYENEVSYISLVTRHANS